MATKKETEETTEVEETEETEETTEETDPEENANWDRMGKLIDERLEAWQSKQAAKKTTSSRSPRKAAAPKRKPGFLTGGFFSGLTDDEE